jgi:hypothetical protein
MVKWIVIAVVVLALIVLIGSVLSVLGKLTGLERALRRLQRRQEEAAKLQRGAAVLEHTVAGLRERAELMEGRLAVIRAGRGGSDGKHSLQKV